MIRLGALSAILAILAQPALALTCAPASVARSTSEAMASDETFVIATGRFAFAPVEGGPEDEPRSFEAAFDGQTLTDRGFTNSVSGPVTVEIGCAGPWCGSLTPDEEVLAFLKRDATGLTLEVGACPHWVFAAPDAAQVETVISCVTGGTCATE